MTYTIHYLPFPADVRGAVMQLSADRYIIGINEALSEDQRERTLRHELRHIRLNHFDDPRPIQEIESEANG